MADRTLKLCETEMMQYSYREVELIGHANVQEVVPGQLIGIDQGAVRATVGPLADLLLFILRDESQVSIITQQLCSLRCLTRELGQPSGPLLRVQIGDLFAVRVVREPVLLPESTSN